jgi:hypothetical protein
MNSGTALLDSKLAMARPVIEHYLRDDAVEAVCLTGSLTADLGTAYSDLDVIAIVPADYERPGFGRTAHHGSTSQHGVGLDRVDVVYRSASWLAEIAALGRPYIATMHSNPAIICGPADLIEDAVRLKLGRVLKPSPRLRQTRDALSTGAEHLRNFMIAKLAADVGAAWMDALGFIGLGDFDSLDVWSRTMLSYALDAWPRTTCTAGRSGYGTAPAARPACSPSMPGSGTSCWTATLLDRGSTIPRLGGSACCSPRSSWSRPSSASDTQANSRRC